MALTDSSSLSTVIDQYLANSNWYGSASAAALRKEAIDWLLVKRPVSYEVAGRSQKLDYEMLRAEFERLNEFLQNNSTLRSPMFSRTVVGGRGRY
ncbi:MAG TPA: hypothetical protein VEK08_27050 [Planctomycetota bacterium]|nr:hypothetical protein [Planctomycetota bacterium]